GRPLGQGVTSPVGGRGSAPATHHFAQSEAFLWSERRQIERARSLLDKWAQKNGYALLRADLCASGPFCLWNRFQSVFDVVVEDLAGKQRRAWVLCGRWSFGIQVLGFWIYWYDGIKIRWREES